MPARVLAISACLLALSVTAAAIGSETPYGDLDFSRLSKPQEEFFWRRLKSLAVEEGVLTYCGQPDEFERRANEGIQPCVTGAALDKATLFFHAELEATKAELRKRKAPCHAGPKPTQGWLGVEIAPATQGTGAAVTGAVANSPAAAADLRAGDVIATLNGVAVTDAKDFSTKIRALAPGSAVRLGFTREGAGRTVSVTLGAAAFDAEGRVALDLPEWISTSKADLNNVSEAVADMCRRCKNSILAMFCH